MKVPSLLAVVVPVACGFIFGPEFVGGVIIGSTVCAIMIAIFTGNAGGARDNSKKSIEAGALEGAGKGSPEHDAAVVGDTVGDPLKDTVGPLPRYLHQDHVHRRAGHRHGLRFPQPGEPARLKCTGTHHSRKRGPDIRSPFFLYDHTCLTIRRLPALRGPPWRPRSPRPPGGRSRR